MCSVHTHYSNLEIKKHRNVQLVCAGLLHTIGVQSLELTQKMPGMVKDRHKDLRHWLDSQAGLAGEGGEHP